MPRTQGPAGWWPLCLSRRGVTLSIWMVGGGGGIPWQLWVCSHLSPVQVSTPAGAGLSLRLPGREPQACPTCHEGWAPHRPALSSKGEKSLQSSSPQCRHLWAGEPGTETSSDPGPPEARLSPSRARKPALAGGGHAAERGSSQAARAPTRPASDDLSHLKTLSVPASPAGVFSTSL